MTDAMPPSPPEPTPEPSPQPPERSPESLRLPKWLMIAGATIAIVAAGTAGVATYLVKTKLSPLVERSLTTLFDRPVEIGAVSGFGLTSVSFDASELPATASDRSFAQIPAVTANFNPFQAIGGELDLTVTLEEPTVTLIQAESGQWLDIKLDSKPSDGFKVQLDTLAIEGGKVSLVPFPTSTPATDLSKSGTNPGTNPGAPASEPLNLTSPDRADSINPASPANPSSPANPADSNSTSNSTTPNQVNPNSDSNRAIPDLTTPDPAAPTQTDPTNLSELGQLNPEDLVDLGLGLDLSPSSNSNSSLNPNSNSSPSSNSANSAPAETDETAPPATPSAAGEASAGETDDPPQDGESPDVEIVQAPNTIELPAIDTLPAPPTSVRLFDVEGQVTIEDEGQRVAFETVGKNGKFGRLDVQGEVQTESGAILLTVAAQNVASEALTTALPLPFELYGGRLFTNLRIALDANNLSEIPLMSGTARGTDVLVALDGAPQPIFIEKTNLAFKERQIAFEDAIGQYGPLPVKIERGLIDLQRGYELPILVPPVDWRVARQAIVPDFAIDGSGEIGAQLILRGPLDQPLLVGQVTNLSPLEIDRLAVSDLDGRFGFSFGTGEFILEQLNLVPASGGQIQAAVKVQLPPDETTPLQALTEFAMVDINADAIAFDYGASLPIDRVSARGRVTLQNDTIGIAIPQIQIGEGLGQIVGRIRGDRWQGEIAVNNIALDPALTPTVNLGAFSGRAQVAGLLDVFSAPDLGKIALQGIGATSVNGQPIQFGAQLGNGQWRVESQLENVPIASFVTLSDPISRLNIGGLTGTVVAAGITSGLQLIPTQIGGSGQLPVEGGIVAGNVTLNGDRWQSQLGIQNVGIAKLLPANLPLTSPRLSSPQLNLAGTTAFDLATIVAQGAFAIAADNGGMQGTIAVRDAGWTVDLAQFALPVPDPWRDQFPLATSTATPSQLSGSIFDFSPSAIVGRVVAALPTSDRDADGNPTGGIAVDLNLDRDQWQAGVIIPPQELDTLLSNQAIAAFTNNTARPNIGGQIAANLALTGGWNGAIPSNINLETSGLQLENLTLNGEMISDRLVGQIVRGALPTTDGTTAFPLVAARYGDLPQFNAADVADDLSIALIEPIDPENPPENPNAIDRVVMQLSRDFMPRLFEAQLGDLRAAGRCPSADRCDFTADQFPLAWLGLQPVPEMGRIEGLLGFDGQVNPTAGSFAGQINWLEPQWGSVTADAISGAVSWRDRRFGVDELAVIRGETRYQFDGGVNLVDDPQIGLKVSVVDGDLQDLLGLFQWSEIEDISRGFAPIELGSIEDLDAVAVGDPARSLLNSIRRLVEIDLLREQREKRTIGRAIVPELRDLEGRFNAELDLGGTVSNPLIEFAARGEDWQWSPYAIPEVQLVGRYRDRHLEFDPSWITANLEPNTLTRLDLNGIVSPDLQSANLELTGLPLAFVGEVAKLPDQFRTVGLLDIAATLAGTQADPRLRGTLHLDDGRLNGKPIELEQGGFFYENGRIRFGGNLLTAGLETVDAAPELPELTESPESPNSAEPDAIEPPPIAPDPSRPVNNTAVTVRGTSPFALPGATQLDPDDRFSVTLATRDDGMAFLNALTDSVGWLGGRGEANITLDGRRQNGIYTVERTLGTAIFDGAILQSPQLPEPLTDVRGTIDLNGDRITVTDLIGNFEQGAVKATGNLSLFNPFAEDSRLTVVLDRVALNLKRIYSGGIDGRIDITGSALLPSIGGYLTLTDGLVFLPDPDAPAPAVDPIGSTPVIRYDDLKIRLDNNIRLVSPPTLDFLADGLLTVRGLLDNPSPAGKIFLRDGRVNLFTTAFTLDQSRFNTAIFDPQYGRDPILDVIMGASVTQTTRNRIVSNLDASDVTRSRELQDTALERGGVETIRISATVQGRASQLFDRLELSSTPARPQLELYSLIGGGVSENTEGGGTVAIASSALLTQIQAIVSRALGLRDFRLFPAFDPRTSSLGLGAEVGIRLTDRLSTSFQVILDRDDSVRFGARYRISDDVILRGSTDFNGEDRGSIEFQMRF
jgi:translocation and assembly module TamB